VKEFFTYGAFRDFLLYAKQYGRVGPLEGWENGNIILRHDVDIDVVSAHRLAAHEVECGIGGTYFFMVTGLYNPNEPLNKVMIREIASWDFEIGLHFNPAIYNVADLSRSAKTEAQALSRIVGKPVLSISLHDPSTYGRYPMFEGFFNAYDPRIFGDEVYLSDSDMQFRGKDPHEFVKDKGDRTIQLLFHPGHFTPFGEGYSGIFRRYMRRICERTDAFWRASEPYSEAFPNGLFLTR